MSLSNVCNFNDSPNPEHGVVFTVEPFFSTHDSGVVHRRTGEVRQMVLCHPGVKFLRYSHDDGMLFVLIGGNAPSEIRAVVDEMSKIGFCTGVH